MQKDLLAHEQTLLDEVKEKVRLFQERVRLYEEQHHASPEQMQMILAEAKKSVAVALAETRMSLDLYGVYHDTDKASLITADFHTGCFFPGHDYLRYYEMMFSPFRFQELLLLEFGCAEGASLRMWEDYFPRADIVGVDIAEYARRFETERTHIVIGDASSRRVRDTIESDAGGRAPFIIIDDASHAWSEQRRSLELFWDMLAPGGFYVIEDLECGTYGAYKKHGYVPEILDAQPFSDFILDRCRIFRHPAHRKDLIRSDPLHAMLPPQICRIEEEMESCLFIPSAVILRKR